ncbi:MAG: YihY/virulence factor BrkB family protein [Ilumatobacter sp.]|nr:YihY/virulence factor BrkB family protein [Ilumatobacter sp.]
MTTTATRDDQQTDHAGDLHTDEPGDHAAGHDRGGDAREPYEIPPRGWKDVALRIKDRFAEDHVSLAASGIAFHGFLALIPLLAAAVSIYGLVADPADVANLIGRMRSALPSDAANLIQSQLDTIVAGSAGALGVGAAIGLASGLWSASSGMSHLVEGINIAYDEDADDRPFWKKRLIAVGLTVLFLALLGAAAAIFAVISGVGGFAGIAVQIAGWLVVATLFGAVLAVFYRFSADRDEPEWSWVSPGAIFTVVAWTVSSFAFGVYVSNFGKYNETYGSLGAVIIVLLWLFVSALVVLLGAELNAELERQTGEDSTEGPDEPMGQRGATVADTEAAR